MTDIAHAAKPKPPRAPGVWGAGLTFAWAVGALVVLVVAQLIAVIVFLALNVDAVMAIANNAMALETNGALLGLAQAFSAPLIVAYFIFAARASGVPVREYLGLKMPRIKHVLISVVSIAALVTVLDLIVGATGHEVDSKFMNDIMKSAHTPLEMWLLGIGIVVLGPLQEEIAFRGFMLPGFAKDWGIWPAIAVTAIIWATLHAQYDWVFTGEIFLIGILLGWLRAWSGSLPLTFLLHAVVNGLAVAQAWLGWT